MRTPLSEACALGNIRLRFYLSTLPISIENFIKWFYPLRKFLLPTWQLNRVLKLFINRIAIMRAENEYVHEKNIELVSNHELVKDMYINYANEIKRMRGKGFYNLVKTNNLQKLAAFARNKILKEINLKKEFPMYWRMLNRRLKRAKSRLNKINTSLMDFHIHIKYNLPTMIFEQICGHLNDRELKVFTGAVRCPAKNTRLKRIKKN